jgi:short-subunit dehydrogenase
MPHEASFFAGRYGPWALVAGGSEGIGRSFALQLAERGLQLVLAARRPEPLEATAAEIRGRFGVQVATHALDLTAPDLEHRLDALIGGREIGLLVYNAGATHGGSLFLDDPVERALALVRLNCCGPLLLVHRLGRAMRQRRRGGVILMASMSGLAGGGYVAAYAATKAFDIALAESLWFELGAAGVDVLGLIAGATSTPAMTRSGARFAAAPAPGAGAASDAASAPPGAARPNLEPMDPDDVAREALEHLGQGPVWIAGAKNREAALGLRGPQREPIVAAMSAAAAQLYSLPFPPYPRDR